MYSKDYHFQTQYFKNYSWHILLSCALKSGVYITLKAYFHTDEPHVKWSVTTNDNHIGQHSDRL